MVRVVEIKQRRLLLPPVLLLLHQSPHLHVFTSQVGVLQEPGLLQDHVERTRAHQEPHEERGARAEPFHREHFHHLNHTLTEKQKQNQITGDQLDLFSPDFSHTIKTEE